MSGELILKYGCNPHQTPARVFVENGELPIRVLNGRAGYINLLDALNAWQLVRELDSATGMPSATSFKHTSPAGAAVGTGLSNEERLMYHVSAGETLSPLACAYIRARGADRMSSFGDFAALSRKCDVATAAYIKNEVSDGIIAPGYEPEALEILKTKRNGNYTVVEIDAEYRPAPVERKQVFGVTFEQARNEAAIDATILNNIVTKSKDLPEEAKRDLIIALITLKYTQSNSVCFAFGGQAIGIGAGQQSRIHCTRLAAEKAELWLLRHHEKALNLPFLPNVKRPDRDNAIGSYLMEEEAEELLSDGSWQRLFAKRPEPLTRAEKLDWLKQFDSVSLASDAFFPFSDNIERAARAGVKYVAEPGGSIRDDAVIDACDAHGMTMAFTGLRLFHH